jgi:hypothetical protein
MHASCKLSLAVLLRIRNLQSPQLKVEACCGKGEEDVLTSQLLLFGANSKKRIRANCLLTISMAILNLKDDNNDFEHNFACVGCYTLYSK